MILTSAFPIVKIPTTREIKAQKWEFKKKMPNNKLCLWRQEADCKREKGKRDRNKAG